MGSSRIPYSYIKSRKPEEIQLITLAGNGDTINGAAKNFEAEHADKAMSKVLDNFHKTKGKDRLEDYYDVLVAEMKTIKGGFFTNCHEGGCTTPAGCASKCPTETYFTKNKPNIIKAGKDAQTRLADPKLFPPAITAEIEKKKPLWTVK